MLTSILGRVLFTILHFIVSILVATQNVYQRLWVKKFKFCKGEVTKSDIQIILQHVPNMKKRPKHLVVLVDSNNHSLSDLACLVIWSLVAGIPYLSFYDREGFMKTNEEKFFYEVERNKKGIPGCIKWRSKPDLNGYTNGIPAYTIVINIFSSEDSHLKIAQCIREIAMGNISLKLGPEEITAQEFDTVLKPFYPDIPEPELALYTGPVCCTNGLLPWQIRLTEFVGLSFNHKISVDGYVGALYKYNKCDQRFGK